MANNQSGAQSSSQESQKKLTFEKLTPTHLSDDEMQGYTQALDFVFQEDDLLNIAITGPYAAGKSSVIKTYEENHKKLNGIHISLSYFSPTLESKIKGKKTDHELAFEDELMLERKIINQLIHQIEPDKIPATEFKVKSESTILTKAIWAGAITFILSFLIFIDKTWLTNWQKENNIALLLFSFFSIVYFIFYKILDLQSRNNLIRKLKIFENEIDISSSECDVSYFDKYLNEIIYILDKSKLDYIVFEDIDRYDDNLILNKLRELNYTYNKKQSKNKPKPIKFFYLIKDEIFESKERTKFFDYILPIVPVMDNSNSLGKMDELFKSQNIYSDFTNTFLDILSDYLDDIRLIKNICNEYIIYKTKLAHSAGWFKNENLLAIIVYKNIFPADYALTRLGLGQGVIHRIIESLKQKKNEFYQSEFYQQQLKKINNEIQLRKEKINTIETCHLKNIDELDALFINIPQDIKDEYHYINKKDIFTLNPKEFIHALKKNNLKITNGDSKGSYYYREHDCKQYFNELEQNSEYKERKKEIEIIPTKNKSTLEAEIKKLEQEKSQLKLPKKIKEIFTINQGDTVTTEALFEAHISEKAELIRENKKYEQYKAEYEKLSSSCYFPLLRVLIIQGYIDEYYSDYTSLFDEQGLSKNDTLFLRNINEYINTEWELELKKTEIVLQRLNADNANRFTGISVLNYSLLDYILEKSKTDDLSRFITILKSYFKTDFVNEYLARYYAFLLNQDKRYTPKHLCIFIKELNIQYPSVWNFIDIFDKKLYLYLSFIHNQPIEINENVDFKNHIENSTDFLFIDDEWNTIFQLLDESSDNLSKIVNAFIKLDIQFKQIDHATPALLALVEENNHYQLNYINAKYILENQYNLAHFDGHIIQTILALNDDAPIKLYFQNQTEALVLSIAQSDIPTIDDSEQTALFILNHNDISLVVKTAYIDKLASIMTSLNKITDKGVWDKLLEKQKIAYSAKNIVDYFFNYKLEDEADGKSETRVINEQLVHFINQNTKNISSSEANLTSLIPKDDELSLFFRRITINSSLDDTKYRMLISWFNGKDYADFNYQHIEKTKISILIKHKAITLGEEQDLNFIRENYPDNILELITHNFEEYINKLREDDSLINHDEIINLLSTDLSVAHKTLLLGLTNDPISINYAKDSVELQKHILENNFNTDDLDYITNNQYYNSTTNVIKNKVKQLCIEYTTQTKQIKSICYNLLIELFSCETFSLDDKYTLLCNHIPRLDAKKTYKALKTIEQDATNQSFFSNLFIAKRPTFENTALNQKIIEELNKKWKFKYKVENSL
ncbi:YobI family P-loop NTPase [Gilliamella sp. Pas-s25]|uniref:YobI family P-loop NTPase n=1 Tax=Gilliamella sp. Pas-s25 TaxID=2687310 RepID=UPI00135E4FBB|nr:hypothetical protein [Gilliamella sp. Pas-s25]MWP62810.1 hypothetical protein [Gilliamella sp. Pas-s25]